MGDPCIRVVCMGVIDYIGTSRGRIIYYATLTTTYTTTVYYTILHYISVDSSSVLNRLSSTSTEGTYF